MELDKIEDDYFNREKIIKKLSNYIDVLKKGSVIAIDAPWGTGKTWFGTKWKEYLIKKEHKVIYIDAFKQDYIDDPFLLIAAEITKIIENGKIKTAFKKNAIEVAKALVSSTPNLVINLASRAVFKTSAEEIIQDNKDLFNDISDLTKNIANKVIEKKLQDHEKEKGSFVKFRNQLEDFCRKQADHPVVIIIDELDRCKPTFAVQLIERIKHLFDVPNLIFVLLMNREQLEYAIKGIYGSDTKANDYLSKFINMYLNLPEISFKEENVKHLNSSPVSRFIISALGEYKFDITTKNIQGFISSLTIWTYIKKLSLRDIERICNLLALSGAGAEKNLNLLTYLLVLKLKHPDLYLGLTRNEEKSIDAINVMLNLEANRFKGIVLDNRMNSIEWNSKLYLLAFQELNKLHHNKNYKPNKLLINNGIDLFDMYFGSNQLNVNQFFAENLALIDLPYIDDYMK